MLSVYCCYSIEHTYSSSRVPKRTTEWTGYIIYRMIEVHISPSNSKTQHTWRSCKTEAKHDVNGATKTHESRIILGCTYITCGQPCSHPIWLKGGSLYLFMHSSKFVVKAIYLSPANRLKLYLISYFWSQKLFNRHFSRISVNL